MGLLPTPGSCARSIPDFSTATDSQSRSGHDEYSPEQVPQKTICDTARKNAENVIQRCGAITCARKSKDEDDAGDPEGPRKLAIATDCLRCNCERKPGGFEGEEKTSGQRDPSRMKPSGIWRKYRAHRPKAVMRALHWRYCFDAFLSPSSVWSA
jgi:hypothetical protein